MSTFISEASWSVTDATGVTRGWGVWTCQNTACRSAVVGILDGRGEPAKWWPDSPVRRPSFEDVPESIASDATEAFVCDQVNAHRAAVVMARRAIQATAFEKGAPDKRPVDQIDWLKDQGLITAQMAEIAHHIRSLGGAGAHPSKDDLESVSAEDAEQVLEFLGHFLTYTYKIPASLDRMRSTGDGG